MCTPRTLQTVNNRSSLRAGTLYFLRSSGSHSVSMISTTETGCTGGKQNPLKLLRAVMSGWTQLLSEGLPSERPAGKATVSQRITPEIQACMWPKPPGSPDLLPPWARPVSMRTDGLHGLAAAQGLHLGSGHSLLFSSGPAAQFSAGAWSQTSDLSTPQAVLAQKPPLLTEASGHEATEPPRACRSVRQIPGPAAHVLLPRLRLRMC